MGFDPVPLSPAEDRGVGVRRRESSNGLLTLPATVNAFLAIGRLVRLCADTLSLQGDASRKPMVELLPSILSADFAHLADQVAAAERGGGTVIHVDVMDGHFVPNITIGPPVVKWLRKFTALPLDCHLMIENPDEFIPAFAEAGASWVSVHYEACRHLHRRWRHAS